jgi:hypothetical protein
LPVDHADVDSQLSGKKVQSVSLYEEHLDPILALTSNTATADDRGFADPM